MLGNLFKSAKSAAGSVLKGGYRIAGAGMRNVPNAFRFGAKGVEMAEGGFVNATNLATGGKKAGNFKEAMSKLFPYANKHNVIGSNELSGLVDKSYLSNHNFHSSGLGDFTHSNITKEGLMSNAVDDAARNRLKNMNVQSVSDGFGKNKNFVTEKITDERAFAPNVNIVKRAIGGAALVTGAYGLVKGLPYAAPDPTVMYDGTNMRQINDMGANANYARAVLGRNSRT